MRRPRTRCRKVRAGQKPLLPVTITFRGREEDLRAFMHEVAEHDVPEHNVLAYFPCVMQVIPDLLGGAAAQPLHGEARAPAVDALADALVSAYRRRKDSQNA